jgi:hypothetical protein
VFRYKVLSHEVFKDHNNCPNLLLAQEAAISTSATFRAVYFGAEIQAVVGFNFQRWRSQEQFRSVAHVYSTCQSCTRFKYQVEAAEVIDQAPHILPDQMTMIYFEISSFRSFNFPTPNFLRSAFARIHRSNSMCPFRSDGHDLLQEFRL